MRRNMTNRVGLAVIAGCIAVGSLAVAGCGGGSSSSTTGASGAGDAGGAGGASGVSGPSGPVLSQSEFVSQVNAICKNTTHQIAKLPASTDAASLIRTATLALPIYKTAYPKAAAIRPPSNLTREYIYWLAGLRSEVAHTERLAAAKAGDKAKARALSAAIVAGRKIDSATAAKMGLTECYY
jgi:hypothetical protein